MTEDIAAQLDKQINFRAFGSLRDPSLLNKLRDPIIHLVRNALDHGIEDKFERLSAGKDEVGRIRVSFLEKGDQTVIEVGDDGKGIDFEVIRERALERGILKSSEKDASNARLLKILFSPSFSSLDHATDISGRGVGLDVVQDVVRSLNGEISVATQDNRGTKFILKIPKV
jgi:two-component system chemotaxis sensor kinase CheA